MKTITLKLLEDLGACSEGIELFKKGNLEGFPKEKLKEVKGDFNGFVRYLRGLPYIEYNGGEYHYEYNDQGLMTLMRYPNGKEYHYSYQYHKSNTLKSITMNGRVVLEVPEFNA